MEKLLTLVGKHFQNVDLDKYDWDGFYPVLDNKAVIVGILDCENSLYTDAEKPGEECEPALTIFNDEFAAVKENGLAACEILGIKPEYDEEEDE